MLEVLRSRRNLCDYEDELVGFDFASHFAAAIEAAEYIFASLVAPTKT